MKLALTVLLRTAVTGGITIVALSASPALAQSTSSATNPVSTVVKPTQQTALPSSPVGNNLGTSTPSNLTQTVTQTTGQVSGAGGVVEQARGNLSNIFQQVHAAIGEVAGFFQNLPGTIGDSLESSLGSLGIPDLGAMIQSVMQAESTPGASTAASAMEGTIAKEGKITAREDLADQAVQQAASGVAQSSALSKAAQSRMQQQLTASENAAQNSADLAANSKQSDVTQQIMQNVSEQMAESAKLQHQVVQEAQQARIDRALDLTLQSQMSEGMSEMNTTQRREDAAARGAVVEGYGAIMLPGGAVLEGSKSR